MPLRCRWKMAHTEDISFENMKRAVIYGSALASFCVERFGTEMIEKISRQQMHERVMQFIELTQLDMKLS